MLQYALPVRYSEFKNGHLFFVNEIENDRITLTNFN